MTKPIYCLSGWGFSGDILLHSVLKGKEAVNLNYFGPDNSSIEAMALHLSSNIPESSVIVAWSLGGLIAIQIAALFPDKVHQLILLSSQPKLIEDENYPGIPSQAMQAFIDLSLQDFETLQKQFIRSVGFPSKRILSKLEDRSLKNCKENLIHWLYQMQCTDLRKEYALLRMEILHILAEKDAVMRQDKSALLALNPKAYVLSIDNAGHSGFLTHTELYAALIDRFLDESHV